MIKYTKTELRSQELRLSQLQKYLPTLQLKKAMLQLEVDNALLILEQLMREISARSEKIEHFSKLLSTEEALPFFASAEVVEVKQRIENIAGVDIPIFEEVLFAPDQYALFDTPIWLEEGIIQIRKLIKTREEALLMRTKKRLLEEELRAVSIRVNLFEKIMIPRTQQNIKKIKIFLGDQFLAAVSQAKVAKRKIEKREMEREAS